jgi:aspartate aminotransferase
MFLDALPALGEDPILALAAVFERDPSPAKVDLGIGVYRDASGRSGVLASVKEAERLLLEEQQTKAYLSPQGEPAFNTAMQALLFGSSAGADPQIVTVQTPGCSGALRIAAELIRRCNGDATVWVPSPTWANHAPILRAAGLIVREYRYHDRVSQTVLFEAMLDDLRGLRRGDVVLLHACCHNPTGADLDAAQWGALADVLVRASAVPLVDVAYQGFGSGIEEDVWALRMLRETVPVLLAASSCSKNFALYRDRIGSISVAAQHRSALKRTHGHVLEIARTLYSMPPDHGAAVVARILRSSSLRAAWLQEVTAMRERLRSMRRAFADLLTHATRHDFAALGAQNGMFSLLDLSPEEVARARAEHHVHLLATGRINLAGLSDANVAHTARAIACVLRTREERT